MASLGHNELSQFSIFHAIYGAVCIQLPISLLIIVRICVLILLSYFHHQNRSMNHLPLFRVRSWNNGMRCINGLLQKGGNSIAKLLELCLSCINPSVSLCSYSYIKYQAYIHMSTYLHSIYVYVAIRYFISYMTRSTLPVDIWRVCFDCMSWNMHFYEIMTIKYVAFELALSLLYCIALYSCSRIWT